MVNRLGQRLRIKLNPFETFRGISHLAISPCCCHPGRMLTELYIEALLADDDLADQLWELWERSTGPRTVEGKAKVAQNSHKGGQRFLRRRLASALKNCKKFLSS